MPIALLDIVITLLVPFLTGAAITFPGRGGIATFLKHAQSAERPLELHAPPWSIRPLRLIVLLLPFLWQALMGTSLLAERLFGVMVVLGLGMLGGAC
ncbi:hypothetical protein ACWD4N_48655, partial [Streptomyces sp. NPDC002586]